MLNFRNLVEPGFEHYAGCTGMCVRKARTRVDMELTAIFAVAPAVEIMALFLEAHASVVSKR